MNILSFFKSITTCVFDMDGVLTDGTLLLDQNNNWLRKMNIRDGYALQLAVKSGLNIIVISGSSSAPVAERLNRLGIKDVFMNISDKEAFLKNILADRGLSLSETLYMGDDIPDYGCMKIVGLSACPSDAAFEIKEIASYISSLQGGCGCVRDVIEKILKLNGKWPLFTTVPST